jgi:hypothetical protein
MDEHDWEYIKPRCSCQAAYERGEGSVSEFCPVHAAHETEPKEALDNWGLGV